MVFIKDVMVTSLEHHRKSHVTDMDVIDTRFPMQFLILIVGFTVKQKVDGFVESYEARPVASSPIG